MTHTKQPHVTYPLGIWKTLSANRRDRQAKYIIFKNENKECHQAHITHQIWFDYAKLLEAEKELHYYMTQLKEIRIGQKTMESRQSLS